MRRWASLGSALLLALAGCGGGSTVSASSDASVSIDGIPVGPASSVHWMAGELPEGYQLAYATNASAPSTGGASGYRQDLAADPYDAELTVSSMPSDSPDAGRYFRGDATTVRGHAAVRVPLTDEGSTYGVALSWEERPGLRIAVSAARPLTEADARLVAEGVQPVVDNVWDKIVVGTDPLAVRDGRVQPDMQRVEVARGTVGSETWVLTALLPAGYPLVSVDRRAACFELAMAGEATNGTSCVGHPSWVRVGGQIFGVGEVPSDTSRVRVTTNKGAIVESEATAAPRWAPTRFWAVPLAEGTCLIRIEPVSGSQVGRGFGVTGPLDGPSTHEDWSRCAGQPAGEATPLPAPDSPALSSVASEPAATG